MATEEKKPAGLALDTIGASVAGVLLLSILVGVAAKRESLFGLNQPAAEHMFEKFVIVGKVGLVALFLLLSFINGHKEYVEKDPRGFMAGSILIAGTSALGGLLIAWNRKRPDLFFESVFIGALFFFLFAVTREFSGYFALMTGEHLQGTQEKQRNVMAPILTVIGIAAILYMIYLAFVARVAPPDSIMGFVPELIGFVTLITIGEVVVAKQHGEKVGSAIGSSVAMFGGAHLLLQYGGFYKEIFGKAPVNWNLFNS